MSVQELLSAGIEAAKFGEQDRARDLLLQVVEQDEENLLAWLWLSGLMDSLDDREICLENVLALDPDNEYARRGLDWIRRQREEAAAVGSPDTWDAPLPTPAAAILRGELAAQVTDVEETFSGPPPPPPEEFDDEYLCPYCAAPTDPDDLKCPACGGDLWVRFRRQEKRSPQLWLLIATQSFNVLFMSTLPVLLMAYALVKGIQEAVGPLSLSDPIKLLFVYLGMRSELTPEVIQNSLQAVPRWEFYLSFLPMLLYSAVLVGLIARWKPAYYLVVGSALLGVAEAFVILAFTPNIVYGLVGLALAVAQLAFVFQVEDDFAWDRRRILMRVDPRLTNWTALVRRGDLYAQQGMWGLAALYLRRAVAWHPDHLGNRLGLAVAYMHLKRYARAAQVLKEARSLDPENPRIARLLDTLEEIQKSEREGEE